MSITTLKRALCTVPIVFMFNTVLIMIAQCISFTENTVGDVAIPTKNIIIAIGGIIACTLYAVVRGFAIHYYFKQPDLKISHLKLKVILVIVFNVLIALIGLSLVMLVRNH